MKQSMHSDIFSQVVFLRFYSFVHFAINAVHITLVTRGARRRPRV